MKKPSSATQRAARPRRLSYPILLAIAAFGMYANTLGNGFTLDDRTVVLEDPRLATLARAGEIVTGGYRPSGPNSLYRPLTTLSFALNRAITGSAPWGFHLVNVLLHVAVTLLVFHVSVLVLESRMAAFVAAFLFALHPIHTEAVANVVGRSELLAAAAVLGASLVLFGGEERRAGRFLGAAAIFAAGLLAKENAVALVPIAVLFALDRSEGTLPARIRALAADWSLWGLAGVAGLYLLLRHAVLGAVAPGIHGEVTFVENPLAYSGAATRLLTAVAILGRYLILAVFPFRLTADYSYNEIPLVTTVLDPDFLQSLAAIAGLAAAAWAVRRRHPVHLLALGFFFAALAPVANILVPIGTIMAERLLYLPSVAAVWSLARLFEAAGWLEDAGDERGWVRFPRKRGVVLALIALVIPWGVKTLARNREWRDDATLFEAARRAAPRSAKVHVLSGDAYFRAGDYMSAMDEYRSALRIYPDYAAAAINLGSAYDAVGQYQDAVQLLESFAGRSGSFETARLRELARAWLGIGDHARAAQLYEQVVAADDADALAHRNLGGLYFEHLGQPERGRAHLRRSLELAPDQPGADQIRAALEGKGR